VALPAAENMTVEPAAGASELGAKVQSAKACAAGSALGGASEGTGAVQGPGEGEETMQTEAWGRANGVSGAPANGDATPHGEEMLGVGRQKRLGFGEKQEEPEEGGAEGKGFRGRGTRVRGRGKRVRGRGKRVWGRGKRVRSKKGRREGQRGRRRRGVPRRRLALGPLRAPVPRGHRGLRRRLHRPHPHLAGPPAHYPHPYPTPSAECTLGAWLVLGWPPPWGSFMRGSISHPVQGGAYPGCLPQDAYPQDTYFHTAHVPGAPYAQVAYEQGTHVQGMSLEQGMSSRYPYQQVEISRVHM